MFYHTSPSSDDLTAHDNTKHVILADDRTGIHFQLVGEGICRSAQNARQTSIKDAVRTKAPPPTTIQTFALKL